MMFLGPGRVEKSPKNTYTFNLQPVTEIKYNNRIIVDDRIEDAEEILQFMTTQAHEGENIYLNPVTLFPMQEYSERAKRTLKNYSLLFEFISNHESEQQQRFLTVPLPESFYDVLEEYLLTLHDIGWYSVDKISGNKTKKNIWHFTEYYPESDAEGPCLVAKAKFLDNINTLLTSDERKAFGYKMISIPVRDGAPTEVKLSSVVYGKNGYSCVKTQQVFLNYFLKQHRTIWSIPDAVLRCLEASYYVLDSSFQMRANSLSNNFAENFRDNLQNFHEQNVMIRSILWGSFVFSHFVSALGHHVEAWQQRNALSRQASVAERNAEQFINILNAVLFLASLYNNRNLTVIFITSSVSYFFAHPFILISVVENAYLCFQFIRNYFTQNPEAENHAPFTFMRNLLARAQEQFFRISFLGSFYSLQEERNSATTQQYQDNNNLMVLYRTPNLSGVIRPELGRQFYITANLMFLSSIIDQIRRVTLTAIAATHTPEETPTSPTNNNMFSQSQAVTFYQPRTVAVRQTSLTPR